MGSFVSSLFGGGASYSAPSAPDYDPVPVREAEADPESASVRDAERRKLRARRGMSGTLLTSPLGVNGTTGGTTGGTTVGATPSLSVGGLLGRSG